MLALLLAVGGARCGGWARCPKGMGQALVPQRQPHRRVVQPPPKHARAYAALGSGEVMRHEANVEDGATDQHAKRVHRQAALGQQPTTTMPRMLAGPWQHSVGRRR